MNTPTNKGRIHKVLLWIESNLDEPIDIKELSEMACYSEFHFHRVFRAFSGESVYGYRKRLLLERAVNRLIYSSASITDIAFDAGYDNQASFNKAFKQQYLCPPSQVRQCREVITAPPLNLTIEGHLDMQATIKTISPITVTCARETGSYQEAAPKAWGRIMKYGHSNRLMVKEVRSIGISHDNPTVTAPEQIRYDACLELDTFIPPEHDLFKHVIAGGKYGVFLHKGPYEGLKNGYSEIFNEWLPNNPFELNNQQPSFEIYLNRDPRKTKPENLRTEIYVPLLD